MRLMWWRILSINPYIQDPPRPDTREVLHKAMEYGIEVKMITGDHVAIAVETAKALGIGHNIVNAAGLPGLDANGKPPADLIKVGRCRLTPG